MLFDNSWFFPMTSPSINPNISAWNPVEMDPGSSDNAWGGDTLQGTVENETKPNDESMEMG